jgi:hypothetical protein
MSNDAKIDLYKLHRDEYAASRKPALVDVGKAQYLAISGQGAPGGEVFTAKVGALYAVAFTIKMTRKFAGKGDYVICKLEGQWWCDGDADLGDVPPEDWRWRLLIRTPDHIKKRDLEEAVGKLLEKEKGEEVKEVRLMSLVEGICVQMLHVGPYDRESESIEQMLAFADSQGLDVHGHHHEIYLSDPRRVAPEKLRTILRVAVRPRPAV